MYKLRPIFPTLDETSVSTCMYKMRKITLHMEAGESNNTETAPTASVDDVRQLTFPSGSKSLTLTTVTFRRKLRNWRKDGR